MKPRRLERRRQGRPQRGGKRAKVRKDWRLPRDRTKPGRVLLRLLVGHGSPAMLEVRVARDRRRFVEAVNFHECQKTADHMDDGSGPAFACVVHTWASKIKRSPKSLVTRGPTGKLFARMYLSIPILRKHGIEIVAHECGHAALAWARHRKADLERDEENDFAYPLGLMVNEILAAIYRHGIL